MDSSTSIICIVVAVIMYLLFCGVIVMDIKDDKGKLCDDLIGDIEKNGFQVWHLLVCIPFSGVIIELILIYLINHLCRLIMHIIVFLFKHIFKPIFTVKIVSEDYLKKWF